MGRQKMARVRKKREGSMGLRGSLNSITPEASAVSDERIDHVTYGGSDATRREREGSHTRHAQRTEQRLSSVRQRPAPYLHRGEVQALDVRAIQRQRH